jgi:hypothetical protein
MLPKARCELVSCPLISEKRTSQPGVAPESFRPYIGCATASKVVSVDKLSIVVAIVFAGWLLHEPIFWPALCRRFVHRRESNNVGPYSLIVVNVFLRIRCAGECTLLSWGTN